MWHDISGGCLVVCYAPSFYKNVKKLEFTLSLNLMFFLTFLGDFFVRLTTLSERNVSHEEDKSNASSRRIGVQWFHLKDSTDIRYKAVYDVPPIKESICFFRR